VLTHLHFDHVGGLLVDGVKEHLRSDLRVHVSAAEVELWRSPDFTRTAIPQEFSEVIRRASAAFLETYRDHLCIFNEEQQVAPGVVARALGLPERLQGPVAWRHVWLGSTAVG
jgi:glyoxylase-like metal-dependent hydrolase (beta-lactamase superfamily II)